MVLCLVFLWCRCRRHRVGLFCRVLHHVVVDYGAPQWPRHETGNGLALPLTVSRCRLPAHQRVAAGRTKRINDGDEEVGAENHRREYQVQGRAPPRTSGEVETARAKKAARDKVAREMMEKFRATLKDEGKKGPSS